ncbi:hypothetical protein [Paenibacillus marinisediminis]
MKKLQLLFALLFTVEFIGVLFVLYDLFTRYNGVMSSGFLLSMALIGLLSWMFTKQLSPIRFKILTGLQITILLLIPIIIGVFYPNYSYEEAKSLLLTHKQDAREFQIQNMEKQSIGLENSGNPFIERGYYFAVNENGVEVEYVVSPVSGKIHILKGERAFGG